MIVSYYDANGGVVSIPELELSTGSLFAAIVLMMERDYELNMIFDCKPLALMSRKNERILISEN